MRLSRNAKYARSGPTDSTPSIFPLTAARVAWLVPLGVALLSTTMGLGLVGCAKSSPGSTTEGPSLPTQSALHRTFAKPQVAGREGARNARTASFGDGLKLVPETRVPDGALSGSLLANMAIPAGAQGESASPLSTRGPCPAGMASIDGRFCVDRYEASLVEILPSGEQRAFPYYSGVDGHDVRAVSVPGVKPQGHISEKQAGEACKASGKRLCKPQEWRTACMGPEKTTWGYGEKKEEARCNDHGRSPIGVLFPRVAGHTWGWDQLNDEKLNQVEGTLAETGAHTGCTNGYGVYDMVGNLHEWVDDPKGTFQGGYYQDTHLNGDGCGYKTTAHNAVYHDYSTGFRCCADTE